MQGWISLHRQITENEFYFSERFTKMQAWIDLILLACWKPETFFVRNNEINLNRGQLGYSIKTLAKRWKWNERTVDKYLSMLSGREMIQYRKTSLTTIITIINYDNYQDNTTQTTSQSMRRLHTYNNINNDNKELAKSLIENDKADVNSVIGKYEKTLGQEKVNTILSGCLNKGNSFQSVNKLAAYLEQCSKTRITDSIPELNAQLEGWN